MSKLKKGIIILTAINLLHAFMHIIQFLQSILIVSYSINKDNIFHKILENPIFAFISIIVGVFTLIIGWKDYKSHQ